MAGAASGPVSEGGGVGCGFAFRGTFGFGFAAAVWAEAVLQNVAEPAANNRRNDRRSGCMSDYFGNASEKHIFPLVVVVRIASDPI
jgi:hypothetical protein